MKAIEKNQISDSHINPVHRDILVTMMLGFLTAIAICTVAAMMASRI